MADAYPLAWPDGQPRHKGPRSTGRFKVGFVIAREELATEVDRLGGRNVVLSTNVELRLDGKPRADRSNPSDPGVAVYMALKGKPMVFACDRWKDVKDNIRAISKTIEALRGIERWGSGSMMERAFDGFTALPSPQDWTERDWWEVLGVPYDATIFQINEAYRRRAKDRHPDNGGSDALMAELNAARDEGLKANG